MRVQFRTEGNIAAGLRRGLIVDTDEKTIAIVGVDDNIIGTDELPVEEANELERLIEVADFFELPATPLVTGSPGRRVGYTVSVTTPGRSHQARLTDPIEHPRVRELVNNLNRLWEKMVDVRLLSRKGDTSRPDL